jgi:hypothetical protein
MHNVVMIFPLQLKTDLMNTDSVTVFEGHITFRQLSELAKFREIR